MGKVKCSSMAGDAPRRAADIPPKKAIPVQPSGLLFSQQADGLGTRKRERGVANREESPDVGETPDLDSERKRRCVTSVAPKAEPRQANEEGHRPAANDRNERAVLDAKKPSAKMASMLCDSECPLPKHATGPSSGDRNTASLASNVAAPGDGAGGGGRTTPPHSELPVTLATPSGPVTTSALATPVRLVTMPMASTPFLSTRKHKAVAGKGGVGVRGTPAPPSQGRDEEERVKTQTQDSRTGPSSMVVGTHPSLGGVGRTIVGMSPFRLFSGMGGKRSKVADTEVVWKEGEEEEEEPWEAVDPLSNGVKYDPVVTNDGFIYPRKQPRKIVRWSGCGQ